MDEAHPRGIEFEARVDLVESMGAEKHVYLPLEGERASTAELEELAADAGASDLSLHGAQVVARLPAESPATPGQPFRLWFDPVRCYLFDPATGRNLTTEGSR